MNKENADQDSYDEERVHYPVPKKEQLISEPATETVGDVEVTTKVFREKVEIIRRHPDGDLIVEVMPTSDSLPSK
ncbi:hypothetical protein [Salinigranum sp. GCM10025319]|uniref:hypothetical protein n=1 Tax=Salinigranum sp. GCM10025319 TaxID=3252687 RepID=UPI003611F4AE